MIVASSGTEHEDRAQISEPLGLGVEGQDLQAPEVLFALDVVHGVRDAASFSIDITLPQLQDVVLAEQVEATGRRACDKGCNGAAGNSAGGSHDSSGGGETEEEMATVSNSPCTT